MARGQTLERRVVSNVIIDQRVGKEGFEWSNGMENIITWTCV